VEAVVKKGFLAKGEWRSSRSGKFTGTEGEFNPENTRKCEKPRRAKRGQKPAELRKDVRREL